MMQGRLVWADALKGCLSLAVIFGHALQFGVLHPMEDYVWNIIYSVHMPAFFAVSGFCAFNPHMSSINWKRIMYRRCQQLFIPFIAWTLILFIVYFHETNQFLSYVQNPDSGYWFLWTLFFICFIFTSIEMLSKKCSIAIEISVIATCMLLGSLMLFLDYRSFGFQFIAYYFLFYTFGFFARKYNIYIKKEFAIIGLCAAWFVMAFFWRLYTAPLFTPADSIIPSEIWEYGYRFIVAIIGILVLFSVALKMNAIINKDSKIVKLGVYSLGSYTTQFLMIPFIVTLTKRIIKVSSDVTIVMVSFMITTVLSVLIITILSKTKITALVFLGKIPQNK